MSQKSTVDVLWTGGWDSSYRVLELLLIHGVPVQPHYILDIDRASSLHELRAIKRIRNRVSELRPDAAERLLESKIAVINEILPDDQTVKQYRSLRSKGFLGGQYEFLSRYARQEHLSGLELSIHQDDTAAALMRPGETVEKCTSEQGFDYWQLNEGARRTDLALFAPFQFPLLEITKTEMKAIAREHGFLDALEESWFCHTPVGNKPCGYCNPCAYTIQEDMGYRLSRTAHVRYRFRSILLPLRVIRDQPERAKSLALARLGRIMVTSEK